MAVIAFCGLDFGTIPPVWKIFLYYLTTEPITKPAPVTDTSAGKKNQTTIADRSISKRLRLGNAHRITSKETLRTTLMPSSAAAVYIALPRIGAASVRGLRRLPRDVGDIQWMAWVRDLASVRQIAAADLALCQHDDGVRRCLPLDEVITLIEQRARDLNVPLTPHERAADRAGAVRASATITPGGIVRPRSRPCLQCSGERYATTARLESPAFGPGSSHIRATVV